MWRKQSTGKSLQATTPLWITLTHWFVWSPSISRTTPFSCNLAAVYFKDCGFHFLLPFSSPLLSSFIDRREFLNTHGTCNVNNVIKPCNSTFRQRFNLSIKYGWDSLSIEVVQAGLYVGVIIVHLVLVEGCFGVESRQRLLKLHKLSLPSLSITSLVTDVLRITALLYRSGRPNTGVQRLFLWE